MKFEPCKPPLIKSLLVFAIVGNALASFLFPNAVAFSVPAFITLGNTFDVAFSASTPTPLSNAFTATLSTPPPSVVLILF